MKTDFEHRMNREIIATFLESLNSKNFDMMNWVIVRSSDDPFETITGYILSRDLVLDKEELECGTTCCLAGWTYAFINDHVIPAGESLAPSLSMEHGHDFHIAKVAAEFLGFDKDEAAMIFYDWNGGFYDSIEGIIDWGCDDDEHLGTHMERLSNYNMADILRKLNSGEITFKVWENEAAANRH